MAKWVRLWLALAILAILFWDKSTDMPIMIAVAASGATPVPAAGMTAFVVALEEYPMWLPTEFAKGAAARIGCESGWQADAVNPESGATGWLQIHPIWKWLVEKMGYTFEDMKRPRPNLDVARAIWQMEDWEPWSCKGE